MAINIRHTYHTAVEVDYYGENGFICRSHDDGSIDAISERVCEVLVKHNFSRAEVVCSADTNKLLMKIERS